MSCTQKLFQALPSPEDQRIQPDNLERAERFEATLRDFVQHSNDANIEGVDADDDFGIILQCAKEAIEEPSCTTDFNTKMARLAMAKPVPIDDPTPKARYLRYCHWVTRGRKDDELKLWTGQVPEPGENQSQNTGLGIPPSSPKTTIMPCAMCGNLGPAESCTTCCVKFGGRVVSGTWYCSMDCQHAHAAAHRDTCHTWRALHRASRMFQELLITFLEINNTDEPAKVTETDDLIKVECEPRLRSEMTGKHLLSVSPRQSYPSEAAALAVLTYGHCGEVLVTLKPLFDSIVRPIFVSVDEVDCVVKNARRPIMREVDGFVEINTANRHVVIRATLPSGAQVALDPTGAQFGWSELVSPWAMYAASRIQQVTSVRAIDLGFRPVNPEFADDMFYTTMAQCWRETIQRVVMTMQGHLNQLGPSGLMTMLSWPDEKFNELAGLMIRDGTNEIKANAREYEQGPLLKLYRDEGGASFLTASEEDYEFLKNVWLTEEEFDQHESDPVRLRNIWWARWLAARASSQPQ